MLFIFKKNHLRKILPILFLIFSVLIFFHKLFYPTPQLIYTPDFGRSDFWHFNYPIKDYLSQSLKNFQLPLWSNQIGNGFPLLAESQIGTFNIFNLILFSLFPTAVAINLAYTLIFIFNSVGCFLLAQELKLKNYAALFLAIIFPLSGFFITHIPHFNLVQSASYLPWLFLFNLRFIRQKKMKDLLLFSLFLSQQIFAGHNQITFISLLGMVIFDLIFLVQMGKKSPIKLTILIFLSIFVGFCLSAIQLLPTWELKKHSFRKTGLSFESATEYPYPLEHIITFFNPYLLGNPKDGTYKRFDNNWGIFWENTAYLGIIPIILTLFFLSSKKKNTLKTPFVVLLIFPFLLVFGKNSPLYFIFTLPPFNWFRVPSRYLLLVSLAIAILATLGFSNLITRLKHKKTKILFVILIIGISFLDLYLNFHNYHPLVKVEEALSELEIVTWLKKEKIQGKIYNYQKGGGEEWNKVFLNHGWQDIQPYLYFKNFLDANLNLTYNLSSIDHFQGLVPRRGKTVLELIDQGIIETDNELLISNFTKNMFDIYSIEYFITPKKIKTGNLNLIKSIRHENDQLPEIYIYQNPNASPLIQIVDNYRVAKDISSFILEINSNAFKPSETVILENEINNVKDNTVLEKSLKSIEVNRNIKLAVETNKKCLLILNNSFYPGWQALIDGQKTEIFAANLNQQAVVVPQGTHTINFIYHPSSFYLGGKISLISLLILFVLFLLAANKNFQILLPFAGLENSQDKSFAKKPKQKHRQAQTPTFS